MRFFNQINPYDVSMVLNWLNHGKITILALSIPHEQRGPFRLPANDRIAWADGMVSPEDVAIVDVKRQRRSPLVFDDLLMGCVMVNVGKCWDDCKIL